MSLFGRCYRSGRGVGVIVLHPNPGQDQGASYASSSSGAKRKLIVTRASSLDIDLKCPHCWHGAMCPGWVSQI